MANDKNISNEWCRLTVTNNLNYLPVILNYVGSVAAHLGFNNEDQKKIELATEEVTASIIEHAFPPDEVGTFYITCLKVPNGLQITIHDDGIPYDPSLDESYNPDATDLDNQSIHGLGGFLIKEFMDEYQFRNLGPEGKETSLVKYFNTGNIISNKSSDSETPKGPKETEMEKIDFSIRLMRPQEAIEVSRCIYDSYGYSYANEHVYYPERIAAFNESGDMRSAVAVTESGEMAGHFAILFYEYLPAEIGIAVTKKKFRGRGLALKLAQFLVDEAHRAEFVGLHVKEVTAHPYTQKFCQKLGYKDCGFLLAHSPKTLSFKGIADELSQRNSDIVGFKYLQKPKSRTIYPPEKHAALIHKLYEDLEVTIDSNGPLRNNIPSNTFTIMDTSINTMRSLGEIHIKHYGPDVIKMLRQELRRLKKEEVRVIEMFLNLFDPMTPIVVPEIEKLGFFFTGILPETDGGDSIIMQYLNGVQIEYDNINVVSDTARELLTYIQKNDPDCA